MKACLSSPEETEKTLAGDFIASVSFQSRGETGWEGLSDSGRRFVSTALEFNQLRLASAAERQSFIRTLTPRLHEELR